MERQLFLFNPSTSTNMPPKLDTSSLKILNWNIQNPSLERAKQQMDWLSTKQINSLILTEVKFSKGGEYILSALEASGFKLFFSTLKQESYFSLVATQGFEVSHFNFDENLEEPGIQSIVLTTAFGPVYLIAIYAPTISIDKSNLQARIAFQHQFHQSLRKLQATSQKNIIIGGDLNVVRPGQAPEKCHFEKEDFEFYNNFLTSSYIDAFSHVNPDKKGFSWVNAYGHGLALDYFFVSENISSLIKECYYGYTPLVEKLSDHAAMFLTL